jgi:hypothetical protein
VAESVARPAEHDMYWIRETGSERNEYVFFRKEFQVNDPQVRGNIHIYVDSWYALYVNGTYIGYGPVRSYHAHPYYDTYDLAPYLKKGKNVIAVKALSNGILTFRLRNYHGGIATWGSIEDNGATIDLNIKNWMSRKAEGYDQTAPRFNFATGAVEVRDTRKDLNWNQPEQNLQNWGKPVRLKNQQQWGEFSKRTIPPLTQHDISVKCILGAYQLSDREDIYSFRISVPDPTMVEYQQKKYDINVYTYIYAPEDCEVAGATWWGNYFLNGEPLSKNKDQPNPTYREDCVFNLKKGWNLFTGKCLTIWANLDFYLALPKGKGLEVSAVKQIGSDELFYSTGPFSDDKEVVARKRSQQTGNPARDLVWKEPDPDAPLPYSKALTEDMQIPVAPNGVTCFFDMGEMQLGRIYLEGAFPDGTVIDIGYSETLDSNGLPAVYKNYHMGPGMRFTASKDVKRYESFNPYGARYLRVNISGNSSPAIISKAGMVRQVYPFETIGSFRCSDEILNRIWEAGWRTLQLCAEDAYTDTPYRERTLYAGDMLPETAITLAVNGDLRLAGHCLNVFQDAYHNAMYLGEEAGEFVLLTLLSLDWYTTYTGDWSLAEKQYDNYKNLLTSLLEKRDNRGLIPEGGLYIEMTDIRKPEVSTAYQAVAVKALRILSSFARKLQLSEDAAYFTTQADLISEAVRKYCWDDNKKAFSDGYDRDKPVDSYFLTSGIWPALFGITTDEQTKYIIEKAKTELRDMDINKPGRKIAAYSSFYLINFLYQNGEAAFAEWYMKKYWAPMVLYTDKPTTWEFFTMNTGTSSHAWTGHPTYFMATEVLGVKLGFQKPFDRDRILIEPNSSNLQWAEGVVTHPAGKVFVRWEIIGDNLFLSCKGPQGIPIEIRPKGHLANYQLWINNKKQK